MVCRLVTQVLAAGFTIAGLYLNLRQAWRELVTRRRVRDFRRRAAEEQHRRAQFGAAQASPFDSCSTKKYVRSIYLRGVGLGREII